MLYTHTHLSEYRLLITLLWRAGSDRPPVMSDDNDGSVLSAKSSGQWPPTGSSAITQLTPEEQMEARQFLLTMELMQKSTIQSMALLRRQYCDTYGEDTIPDDFKHVMAVAKEMSTLGSTESVTGKWIYSSKDDIVMHAFGINDCNNTVSAGGSSRRPKTGNKHVLERSPGNESKRQKASSFDISQWTVSTSLRGYAATVRKKSKSDEAVKVMSTSLIIRYKRDGDKKKCTLTLCPSRDQLEEGPEALVDFLFPIVKGVKCNRIWMEKDRFPTVEKEADAEALADMALNSTTVKDAWTGFANDRETFWEKCKAHDAENLAA